MKYLKNLFLVVVLFIMSFGVTFYGCDNENEISSAPTAFLEYVQIERLANPGINEGLLISNAFLNAFNSIPPSADLSEDASDVVAEAAETLTLFLVTVGGGDTQDVSDAAASFLPDVMRVDTSLDIAVGDQAFASALNAEGNSNPGRPVAGRKIEDDVVDTILTVLTQGAITTDNVSYVGENMVAQGHSVLLGQGAPLGAANFPFLAAPL